MGGTSFTGSTKLGCAGTAETARFVRQVWLERTMILILPVTSKHVLYECEQAGPTTAEPVFGKILWGKPLAKVLPTSKSSSCDPYCPCMLLLTADIARVRKEEDADPTLASANLTDLPCWQEMWAIQIDVRWFFQLARQAG